MWALYHGHRDLAAMLCARCAHVDVFTAAAMNDVAALRDHIAHDATCMTQFSPDGFQALGLACFFGAVEAAQLCVTAGASVDECSHNSFAVAPLHSATAADSLPLVELLLAAGADPNIRQSGGFSPLHGAAQHGNHPIITMLIHAGADITLQNDDGQTAHDCLRTDHDPRCNALLHISTAQGDS